MDGICTLQALNNYFLINGLSHVALWDEGILNQMEDVHSLYAPAIQSVVY